MAQLSDKDPLAMANTPPTARSKRLTVLIAAAAVGALALAGVVLVKTDEHMGTAHVPVEQVLAAHPDKARDLAQDGDEAASPAYEAPPAFVATAAPPAAPQTAPQQAGFVIKRTLTINEPIKYGQWFWNDKDVAAGPIVITVDLDARVLSIFRDGVEIGTTAVLLGTQEKPTPLGVFPITQKDEHHVSNLYDAKMPYMMRLTDDGVSIHATHVQNGYASHGCIGVPLDFAQKIFAITHLGDKVYITRGKQAKIGDRIG
jgi:lipoprotein-anchoring transpeptidase ErfK/SrfK